MNFRDIHEHLRLELLRRIDRGVLSGSLLARQSGFRPAHISNVLNRKRLLSPEGLDRILAATNLSIEQLLVFEGTLAPKIRPGKGETVSVPIVSAAAVLHHPSLSGSETLHIPESHLHGNRARPAPIRAHWQRYAALVLNADQAAPMEPQLSSGALAVIDRLYTSLAPYREPHPTLYAVHCDGQLLFRFAALEQGQLILRPLNPIYPVRLLRLHAHDMPYNHIIGRVCLVLASV